MSTTSPPPLTSTPSPLVVIRPTSGWVPVRLGELWSHRELLYFLAWRDLKVRYAQTVFGALWTVFQPLALMLVFTLAFRRLTKIPVGDVPYPVFALAGLVFWMFFSRAVTRGASSLVASSELLTKAAFPRLLIPVSTVTSGLVDFLVGLSLFFVFAAGYGSFPSWRLSLLPLVLLLGLVLALGVVLLLSAMNVRYRDVAQALPFVIQLWLFLSPVAYPLRTLGEPWTSILALNPLVGVIESFRWALLGTAPPTILTLTLAVGVSVLTLVSGLAYFTRLDRSFADVI